MKDGTKKLACAGAATMCAIGSMSAQFPGWRVLTPSTRPAARYEHAMAYDQAREVTVLFGGANDLGIPLGDTWAWDGSAWQQVASTGPDARQGHAMAYHPPTGRVILFGGQGVVSGIANDTWSWDGAS